MMKDKVSIRNLSSRSLPQRKTRHSRTNSSQGDVQDKKGMFVRTEWAIVLGWIDNSNMYYAC